MGKNLPKTFSIKAKHQFIDTTFGQHRFIQQLTKHLTLLLSLS